MSDYIPQDALSDILGRLPIKTLVRCTSVCKSWRSLITNPKFITSHLNNPANNIAKDLILARSYSYKKPHEGKFSLHYDDNKTLGEYSRPAFHLACDNYRAVGVCSGVICITDDATMYGTNMFLWNPSIEKLVKVPKARVYFSTHGEFMHALGFGIDPLINDFKIVRVVYLNSSVIPAEVDVYSLSTGTWVDISARVSLRMFISEQASQAYLNGIVHWFGYYGTGKMQSTCNVIVSFHMGNEVFGEMELPSSVAGKDYWENDVCAFVYQQHSLALKETEMGKRGCAIWVMREYGKAESWTKLYSINFGERPPRPVMFGENEEYTRIAGFRKNGDILLDTKRGFLSSYDPKTNTVQNLGISSISKDFEGHKNLFIADSYTESVALLGVPGVSDTEKLHYLSEKPNGEGGQGNEAKQVVDGIKN